jgi:DNA polymerase elongation subunit (family B)
MRSFNISPESYIEKINNIDLIESRKNEDVIITSIGTVFKKEKSILKGILDDIYQQRKDYKKISKDAEKMVLKLEQELKKLN